MKKTLLLVIYTGLCSTSYANQYPYGIVETLDDFNLKGAVSKLVSQQVFLSPQFTSEELSQGKYGNLQDTSKQVKKSYQIDEYITSAHMV